MAARPASTKAWITLASGVAVYDIWAMMCDKETMSAAFERAVRHPMKRWIVMLCWAFTTKHLFLKHILSKYDPFNILALAVMGLKIFIKEKENGLVNA